MSPSLRILMVLGAVAVFYVIASRIKKRKILMADATYWVVLGLLLLVAALVPDLIMWLAGALGFMSPANFVFLCVIGLLLIKMFGNSAEISLLKHKVEELTQELALYQDKNDRARQGQGHEGEE